MKRLCILFCFLSLMLLPVSAEPIKWVDFDVPYESMKYAMEEDIRTFEQEKHLNWIDILCVAACRTGGKCGLKSVQKAAAVSSQLDSIARIVAWPLSRSRAACSLALCS